MAYVPSTGESILFGGQSKDGSYLADTWSWNGVEWKELHPSSTPPARFGAKLVFDPTTHSAILIGGTGQTSASGIGPLSDMWSWNGLTWTQLHPRHLPSARVDASVTYDDKLRAILLFGGDAGDRIPVMKNDLWLWTGLDWAEQNESFAPPARSAATMVFDPASGAILLFGGTNGIPLDDTWSWDGKSWTELHPIQSPTRRYSASAVYEAATGNVILFGGEGGDLSMGSFHALDDTWLWNGSNWVEPHPSNSPPARWLASISYDAKNRVVVLFGGPAPNKASPPLDDTWIWNGSNWNQATRP
jgi:hypothetical protein